MPEILLSYIGRMLERHVFLFYSDLPQRDRNRVPDYVSHKLEAVTRLQESEVRQIW